MKGLGIAVVGVGLQRQRSTEAATITSFCSRGRDLWEVSHVGAEDKGCGGGGGVGAHSQQPVGSQMLPRGTAHVLKKKVDRRGGGGGGGYAPGADP